MGISVASMGILLRMKKIPEPALILVAGAVGLVIQQSR
jgi:hypothetical protein